MSRLFQINEEDLAELERLLPDFSERLAHAEAYLRQQAGEQSDDNRLNVQVRRLQQIMLNVRWNYQPHASITTISADGDEATEPA